MPACAILVTVATSPLLAAAVGRVEHRITSDLIDGFSQWWQMPALVLAVAALGGFVLWVYRRDAAELPRSRGVPLVLLRLAGCAALVVAYLDLERTAEHEILFPSRVAVLVDSSASMTLAGRGPKQQPDAADQPEASRAFEARRILEEGGLLERLTRTHEVSIWRFDADAEPLTVLSDRREQHANPHDLESEPAPATHAGPEETWQERLVARGYETRLGEALLRSLDREPKEALAGVVVLSDGANNAGTDPAGAAVALAAAGVPILPIGIGSAALPANVRVADVAAPARVFPGDRFAVTAYLQPQGFSGQEARIELLEGSSDEPGQPGAPGGRVIDAIDVRLGNDGELQTVRFDVPGLATAGSRTVAVRVRPPPNDSSSNDDVAAVDIEVVDRVTQVLLMAGGPGRDYQFLRNTLGRDKSFAVDVLLGTARPGLSQDARKILDAFPPSAAALADYDVIVAMDYDWRLLDPAAQSRLERWVARESGGLLLVAGNVFMDAWLADQSSETLRNLHPVELRRSGIATDTPVGAEEPRPLRFTRDGEDAEFFWLAPSRIASQTLWSEFAGVYACYPATAAKPGATVFARAGRPGIPLTTDDPQAAVFFAGQFYGSGNVLYVGSGELWRLRGVETDAFDRLATQLLRHVAQGRLLRGSRQARLLVERDRYPVGATVVARIVMDEEVAPSLRPSMEVITPEGSTIRVPLRAEPTQPGQLQGSFVAGSEGAWRIGVDLGIDAGERLSKRIQSTLPDRELARPRLDRDLLDQLAAVSGGRPRFLNDRPWEAGDADQLAAAIPDRSRREYETGSPDGAFKRWLNGLLLALGVGSLCLEWVLRRLFTLA
jgi:hypothetical protein